jgi:hypothetical protein
VLTCRVVGTKRVDAKWRVSGGGEQVVADVNKATRGVGSVKSYLITYRVLILKLLA